MGRAQVLRLVQNGTAAEDFSAEVRTSADRFSRRQNAEKSLRAVEDVVARGVA